MEILLVLDDDHGLLAGGFIGFLLHRHTLDDVMEPDPAGLLGEDRHIVGIPLHEVWFRSLLHLDRHRDRNDGPDDDVVDSSSRPSSSARTETTRSC
jgi:hypothetical protein